MANLSIARALTANRVRLDFDAPVDYNAALLDRSNYLIEPTASGAPVTVLSIHEPSSSSPTSVELEATEMTDAASYEASVNPGTPTNPITDGGVPVPSTPVSFSGVGELPYVALVIATSETTAEVRFSETMLAYGDITQASSYTFDLGLSVVSVDSISGGVVSLTTSLQTAGTLYTATITGSFEDGSKNAMASPATSPMLGFVESVAEVAALNLRMYNFLIQSIRDMDQAADQFWERYLEGPQAQWDITTNILLAVPYLWSVTQIPDDFLKYLKNIVGWTDDLDPITDVLDAPTLRRLIANSIAFWKSRGTETSTADILRLVTAERVRVINWFWYRFVVGETELSTEYEGHDFMLTPFPGDEYWYDVRIVDSGDLDKRLVIELLKLTRPIGERVSVEFLTFMDEFASDGDNSQWTDNTTVQNGFLTVLAADPETYVSLDAASLWTNYALSIRMRWSGDTASVEFYRSGPDDYYEVQLDATANTIALVSVLAGTPTTIVTEDLSVHDITLYDDVWYTIGIEATPAGSDTVVKVSVDSSQIIVESDPDHTNGTFGVIATGDQVDIDIVEMFELPLPSATIDINNVVTSTVEL